MIERRWKHGIRSNSALNCKLVIKWRIKKKRKSWRCKHGKTRIETKQFRKLHESTSIMLRWLVIKCSTVCGPNHTATQPVVTPLLDTKSNYTPPSTTHRRSLCVLSVCAWGWAWSDTTCSNTLIVRKEGRKVGRKGGNMKEKVRGREILRVIDDKSKDRWSAGIRLRDSRMMCN